MREKTGRIRDFRFRVLTSQRPKCPMVLPL